MNPMPKPSKAKLRVLVVDDDLDIAGLVADGFKLAGCEVEIATSGRLAQEALSQRTFDVLLTDIRMPDGGGIELLNWLEREKQDISPFVMTGFGDVSMEMALRSGALGFFSKPFDVGFIVKTVCKLAGGDP